MEDKLHWLLHREGVRLASFGKRMMATGIDEIILSILLIVIIWENLTQIQDYQQAILFVNGYLLEFLLVKMIYQTFFVMQYGATPGKIIMKIRVIEIATLDNPSLASAINRGVFRVISEVVLYLGFLWGIFDSNRQTWHDKTAKTVVIDA